MEDHVALTKCYFCGEDNQVLLATSYRRKPDGTLKPTVDVGAMHGKIVNMDPCSKCQEFMKQGIILIGIDPEKSDPGWNREKMPNPWRTGEVIVVKEEALKKILLKGPEESRILEFAKKFRFMFVEQKVLKMFLETS